MKVVLISLSKPYLLNPASTPPLGLLYIANSIKDQYEVEIVDLALENKIPDAEIYGISITTPDFYESIEILKNIKERNPEAKVIAGGPHATVSPHECLSAGFDAVSIGDGELTIKKLINGERIAICWADEKIMDTFYPDRKIIDLWKYKFYVDNIRATTLMTARGCKWAELTGGCAFCSRCDNGKIRYHSVKHVENEIAEIAELGFKAIQMYDDEFFTNPKRDEKIIELFPEYDIEVWRCFGKSDFILRCKDLVKKAVKCGLKEMLLGIESGSQKILKIIRKGTTPNLNEKVIRFLHDLGVKVKSAMIVGLPGESLETLVETWKWCEKVEKYISALDWTIFTPYPGSAIYENPEKYDIKFDKKSIYTAYKGMHTKDWKPCKIETSSLTFEQILKARDLLEKRFKFGEDISLNDFIKEIEKQKGDDKYDLLHN